MRPGDLVRVMGRGRGHANCARLLAIDGDRVQVHPFGHRRTEWMPRRQVRPWRGGSNLQREIRNNRLHGDSR